MAEVLLIKTSDVLTYTNFSGNVDRDKWRQYIKIAQDINIEPTLGTDLTAKLKSEVLADTLSGNYATLLNTWVKPALIHWTAYEALPFLDVVVSNGGIYRHTSENADNLTKEELDSHMDRHRERAIFYTKRLNDYLCNNSSLFPEYNTNSGSDLSPNNDQNYSTWVL